jgi:hypothetical protein
VELNLHVIASYLIIVAIFYSVQYWTSKGQNSWPQIQRSGFDSRRYHIFLLVVGLERGPLSLVSTTEELLGRKSSGSGTVNREYSHRDSSLGQYSSLADYGHGVSVVVIIIIIIIIQLVKNN